MGFEASPPNEFRASLRGGARKPVVVAEKYAQSDPSAEGLEGVKVPRSEFRRKDQRGEDRHRLADEHAVVRHAGESHTVELINVSQGGAMIVADFAPHLWDQVYLVLGESGAVECAVTWIRDGKIGLEFAHETQIDCDRGMHDELLRDVIRNSFPDVEMKARPANAELGDGNDQKRDAHRHPLIWGGVLHHDFEWQAARVRNISATGALIECTTEVPVGANVFLDLQEAGRIGAQVSWTRGDQMGLLFAMPFDVSSLSKATPILATKSTVKSHFAPYGRGCDQSPWAPEWKRLSIDDLGAELGG